jgi:hypothetical protein
VAEEKIGIGSRVLRDELYPIKVDGVKRARSLRASEPLVRYTTIEPYGFAASLLLSHVILAI